MRINLVSLLSRTFISSVILSGWWKSTVNAGTQVLDGRDHPQTGFLLLDHEAQRLGGFGTWGAERDGLNIHASVLPGQRPDPQPQHSRFSVS